MSLVNVFGDGLLDVWTEAFGLVWFGAEFVFQPAAPCRTLYVAPERRIVRVEAETRVLVVSRENRIMEVRCP